jgi:hypothetical protein
MKHAEVPATLRPASHVNVTAGEPVTFPQRYEYEAHRDTVQLSPLGLKRGVPDYLVFVPLCITV